MKSKASCTRTGTPDLPRCEMHQVVDAVDLFQLGRDVFDVNAVVPSGHHKGAQRARIIQARMLEVDLVRNLLARAGRPVAWIRVGMPSSKRTATPNPSLLTLDQESWPAPPAFR